MVWESRRVEGSGGMERIGPQSEGPLGTSPGPFCGRRHRVGGKLAGISSFGVLHGETEGGS